MAPEKFYACGKCKSNGYVKGDPLTDCPECHAPIQGLGLYARILKASNRVSNPSMPAWSALAKELGWRIVECGPYFEVFGPEPKAAV